MVDKAGQGEQRALWAHSQGRALRHHKDSRLLFQSLCCINQAVKAKLDPDRSPLELRLLNHC